MKKIAEIFANFILAYVTVLAVAGVSGYGITGIDIMLPCIFIFAYVIYYRAYKLVISGKNPDDKRIIRRNIFCAMPVAVLFAAGATIGSHYKIWDQTITSMGAKDCLYFVILAVFFEAGILTIFSLLDNRESNTDSTEKKTDKIEKKCVFKIKQFYYFAGLMMLCWMPYYLTVFPGNIGADTIEEVSMCIGKIPWTNHHPVFYTMLMDGVIKLTSSTGSLTVAMAVFAFLQMLLLAMTLGYILIWIRRHLQSNRWITPAAFIFFALNPVMAMYSVYLTKDVLFSCALVLFALKLRDYVAVRDKKELISIAIWATLVMLLRNNGLMIIAIAFLVVIIVCRTNWREILIALLIPFVVFGGFRLAAYKVLNIAPQSFAESASIPLQQTGYVISSYDIDELGISDTDINTLKNIMPFEKVKEVYQLGYTDPLKFDEEFNDKYLNEHSGEYMSAWLHMLPTHLSDYVKAYLAQTAGYWHYGESNTLCTQGVTDNELGIKATDVIRNATGISLSGIIEKMMLLLRKAPLLCILTSMAMQFYMLLLLIVNYVRKKKKANVILGVPFIILWLTIMIASPAFCLFRYTFALYLMWPVFLGELSDN